MTDQKQPEKARHGFQHMMQSIDEFFSRSLDSLPYQPLFVSPIPIRVAELTDGFYITAQLAGVSKKQIELNVYHQAVQIIIHDKEETGITDKINEKQLIRSKHERRERTIRVPFLIDYNKVEANFHNGLLEIKLQEKHKTINLE
ncbi:Hsp20/alpha crystallin family protein [Alkalihalobacillus sp. 1P02AB]|uniref:Hsp20/alpha crystallin family protein n=1 Tax=Alkalihalobacillus sp. 1P02AB TaxID=3132260 RepID=UPI0039A759A8